jgi:DNA-directed RNA polymerase subunit RPC12/RpoP
MRSTCPRCGELVELDKVTKAMLNPARDRVRHPKALHICQGTKSDKAIDHAAVIPTAQEVQPFNDKTNPSGYKPPVWGAKIEMDNMSRHEWPVCKELGLGQRVNYRDVNATSDGAPSQTSQIRRMALAEQKKNAALKEVILAPGQVKCPYCDFKKSRMFVNNHIKLSHIGKALLD